MTVNTTVHYVTADEVERIADANDTPVVEVFGCYATVLIDHDTGLPVMYRQVVPA